MREKYAKKKRENILSLIDIARDTTEIKSKKYQAEGTDGYAKMDTQYL